MKLTGNALSMLLKRYRAVLGKCRTLNWLAGLVLAGGLVLGSVSGALADATPDPTAPVTWNSTLDNPKTDYWKTAPLLIVNGANVTINATGAATQADGGTGRAGSYLAISGGTVNISGGTGTAVADTSLWGYGGGYNDDATPHANTISGGTININFGVLGSSQFVTGAANGLIISGGTINFNGSAVNTAILGVTGGGTDGNTPAFMTIKDSAQLLVASGKVGTIGMRAGTANFEGGLIDVAGTLVSGKYTSTNNNNVVWNISGGKLNVTGNLQIRSGVSYNVYAGSMNVNGGLVSVGDFKPADWAGPAGTAGALTGSNDFSAAGNGITVGDTGSLNVTNGGMIYLAQPGAGTTGAPLTIDGGTVEISGQATAVNGTGTAKINSRIWAGKLTINGGTVNIGGGALQNTYQRWYRNYLAGYGGVAINGGTINLNAGSELQAGSSQGLKIQGGTIKLAGSAAPYYSYFLGNDPVAAENAPYKNNGVANILFTGTAAQNTISGGTINVAAGKHGSLLIGTGVTMSGGNINVANTGTLYIDTIASYEQPDPGTGVTIGQSTATNVFAQTGGSVTVNGTLNIQGGTAYTISGASSTMTAGAGATIQIAPAYNIVASGSSTVTGVASSFTVGDSATADWSKAAAVNNYGVITINDTQNSTGSYSNLLVNATTLSNGLLGSATNKGQVLVTKGVLDLGNSSTPITLNTAGASANFAFGSSAAPGKIVLDSNGQIKAGAVVLESDAAAFTFNQANTTLVARQSLGTNGTSKSIALSNGTIRLGSPQTTTGQLKTSVTVSSDGQLLVHGGTWTLGNNLTVDAGGGNNGVTIGNGSSPATLDVSQAGAVVTTGDNTYQPLKSGAAGDGTKGINVLNNGTLTALANQLTNVVTDANGKVTSISALQANLNTLYVGTGGTVSLVGIKEITTTDLSTLKNTLFGASAAGLHGTLDLGKVTISGINTATGITVSQAGQLAGLDLPDVNIVDTDSTNATPALAGSFGTVTLKNAAATGVAVATGTTLELNGTAGQNLITAQASSAANKVGALTVGADGGAILNQGVVGAVTLTAGTGSGANTVLQVNGAETGAITAANNTAITLEGKSIVGNITSSSALTNSNVAVATGATAHAGTIGNGTAAVTSLTNSGGLTASSVNATTLTNTGTLNSSGAISADNLNVNSGSVSAAGITANTGMTVKNGATVTSTDNNGISANGGINSTDGTISTGGTLTSGQIDATNSQISAKKLSVSSATVSMTGGKLTLDGINDGTTDNSSSVDGALSLGDVDISIGDLKVTGSNNATFNAGTSGTIQKLDMDTGGAVRIGGDEAQGQSTELGIYQLAGSATSFIVDPSWSAGSAKVWYYNGAAQSAVVPVSVTLATDVGVGQNSMLTVGFNNNDWLLSQVNDVAGSINSTTGTGLSQGKYEAALGVYNSYDIPSGKSLRIDGTKDGTTGKTFDFTSGSNFEQAANTLLVVRGDAAGVAYTTDNATEKAAATGAITYGKATSATGGTTNIAQNSYLRVTGAQDGKSYKIIGTGFNALTSSDTVWNENNVSSDNALISLTLDTDNPGSVKAARQDASKVMPSLDPALAAMLNDAIAQDQIGTKEDQLKSADKGVQFLSRAISDKYLDAKANPDLAAQTIEGAARMVTIGAVPQMTRTANQAAAEAVTQRTSMAIPSSSIQTQQATDKVALWIMPLYQSTNGSRLDAGNFDADYHGGLGGIALGADYTFANAIRAGIAFNIGAGYATGGGDFADTTNNMNFWGLGAYAGWTGNNIGVSADVNFTSAYNKLTQDLPQSMGMRDLKADVRSYAFSTGLRGEYKLETSAVDITPHVGVRFMYLTTDDYKVKSEGTVLKGDGLHQNIWTFPIGVSFSKNIERSNGWHVKPMLDLAVVPAAGDIKAKENVRFSGTDYKAELETQVMDYITYQGVLGLEVGNQNLTFGLSGNTQFGEKTSGYGVLGSFRYEF